MANIDAVRTAVRTERTARAQGAASRQVHFAAVMGRSIDGTLAAPRDWNVHGALANDPNLQDLASRFGWSSREERDVLRVAAAHIEWVLCECATTLKAALPVSPVHRNPPNPTLNSSGSSHGGSGSGSGSSDSSGA